MTTERVEREALLELTQRMKSRLVMRSCISNDEWQQVADEIETLAAPSDAAPVRVDGKMTRASRDWIEGMEVSVDVSSDDETAEHRYFGTVTEVMDDTDGKHGVILLVQNAKPNFTAAPVRGDDDHIVGANKKVGCEGSDGLLRVHLETEDCDVCRPATSGDGVRVPEEVRAWQAEDGRVISAAQKNAGMRGGGASATSVRPYSQPLFAAAPQPPSAIVHVNPPEPMQVEGDVDTKAVKLGKDGWTEWVIDRHDAHQWSWSHTKGAADIVRYRIVREAAGGGGAA